MVRNVPEELFSLISVLDRLPIVSYIADCEGQVLYVSKAWDSMLGSDSRELVLDQGYTSVGQPDDLNQVVELWDTARNMRDVYAHEFRLRLADGSERWILSQAREYVLEGADTPIAWIGTITDVHTRKISDLAIRTQAEFIESFMNASYDCVKILTLEGRIVSINDNGKRALGIDPDTCIIDEDWLSMWTSDEQIKARAAFEAALQGKQGRFIGRYDVHGAIRWWDVAVNTVSDASGTATQFLVVSRDITLQRMQLDEQRRKRDLLHSRTQALVAAGDTLLRSLDPSQTVAAIAQLAVQSIASFCTIDLFKSGQIRRVAAVHARPELDAMTARLLTYPPAPEQKRHPVVGVFSNQASKLGTLHETDSLEIIDIGTAEASILEELNAYSYITVPIASGDQQLGAITFYRDTSDVASGRHAAYDDADLAFCEELGQRAGAALANAHRYGRERHIALEMQKAALPRILPLIDHLRFTADYRPGNSEATIGGDWYDAFALTDGRIVLTIGDVIGNGLKAAMTMITLRRTIRTAALSDPDPNRILQIADLALFLEESEIYATAAVAIFDPATHNVTMANAGHPAPVLRDPQGGTHSITVSGLMLGIAKNVERSAITFHVENESAIVFFTDGILENTHDIADGYKRLHAAVGLIDLHHSGNVAAKLVEMVLGGDESNDDIAVMIATVGILTQPTLPVPAENEIIAASA
jgi:PAS domain S-box-containing protein